jgi:hypothetical protein
VRCLPTPLALLALLILLTLFTLRTLLTLLTLFTQEEDINVEKFRRIFMVDKLYESGANDGRASHSTVVPLLLRCYSLTPQP